jgi:Zn-dependent peptidase ImmA (M78 family)
MSAVPFLTRDYIESKAHQVLSSVNARYVKEPSLTPLAEIIEKLIAAGQLSLRIDDLGVSGRRRKVLGAFLFDPPTILIDQSLDQGGPRFRFTLAHELGHWTLHRDLDLSFNELDATQRGVRDSRSHLFFGQRKLTTLRDRLEFQANFFAASLLAPRCAVEKVILEKQKNLGITRNLGKIYVDAQRQNRQDFDVIVSELLAIFQTSRTMMIIRLRQLGILIQDCKDEPRHIATHIRGLFREETIPQ